MRKKIGFSLSIFVWGVSVIYAQAHPPDLVEVQHTGLAPEGIAYDANGERFLLGSLSEGTIFAVTDDGTISPFIEDADLVSSVGLEIDEENQRLLVCNSIVEVFSDDSVQGEISLAAYDLETGERHFLAQLTDLYEGRHFANDVTIDAAGNAYVTDTMSPVIYVVTPEGEASIFTDDERLSSPFGLNGIVFHPDGYLLVSDMGIGGIYKVPLDDPSSMTQVDLANSVIADGMVLDAYGDLVLMDSGTADIVALHSEDDFVSAEEVAYSSNHLEATTLALRGEDIYAIYAYLNQPEQAIYQIVRVDFGQN